MPSISFVFVGKQKLSVPKDKGREIPHGVSAVEAFPGFLLKWEIVGFRFFVLFVFFLGGGRAGREGILFLVFYI